MNLLKHLTQKAISADLWPLPCQRLFYVSLTNRNFSKTNFLIVIHCHQSLHRYENYCFINWKFIFNCAAYLTYEDSGNSPYLELHPFCSGTKMFSLKWSDVMQGKNNIWENFFQNGTEVGMVVLLVILKAMFKHLLICRNVFVVC